MWHYVRLMNGFTCKCLIIWSQVILSFGLKLIVYNTAQKSTIFNCSVPIHLNHFSLNILPIVFIIRKRVVQKDIWKKYMYTYNNNCIQNIQRRREKLYGDFKFALTTFSLFKSRQFHFIRNSCVRGHNIVQVILWFKRLRAFS